MSPTASTLHILSEKERQSEIEALRRHGRLWDKAMADLNLDLAVSYFASDAYTIQPNQKLGKGLEEIRRIWADYLKLPGFVFTTDPLAIEVASAGDLAYEIGSYVFGFDTEHGRFNDTGHYVLVYKREDGEWKLAVDVPASDQPRVA